MAYTNWQGRAAHYGNLKEIKKRAKFDRDKFSDLMGMTQQIGKFATDHAKNRLEDIALADKGEKHGLTAEYEDRKARNLWGLLGRDLEGFVGEEEDYSYKMSPSQLKWFEENKLARDIDFNDFKNIAPLEKVVKNLPTNSEGDLVDTETVNRSDGTIVEVNAIEKNVYDSGNEQLVDDFSGEPKYDEYGIRVQTIDPSTAMSLGEASQTINWSAAGQQILKTGADAPGATSGAKLKSLGMSALMAANPILGIGAMAADWIYGSAQAAKAARKQIEKIEDGITSLENSQTQAQNVLSNKAQEALDISENKVNTLIDASTSKLQNAGSTAEVIKKKAKGLSTGASETVVTSVASDIENSLNKEVESISSATYSSIGDISRAGLAEIENIGFQIDDFKDQVKTLEGQDSTYEQMFGSNIGGKLEEWIG